MDIETVFVRKTSQLITKHGNARTLPIINIWRLCVTNQRHASNDALHINLWTKPKSSPNSEGNNNNAISVKKKPEKL